MSNSPTPTLPLPVTVSVAANGAVSIESPTRVVGMSPFSERAQRLTRAFGQGDHTLRTDADVAAIADRAADIAEALS
jgi:hypothetical protein